MTDELISSLYIDGNDYDEAGASHRSPRQGRGWVRRRHTSYYMNVDFGDVENYQNSYRQKLSVREWDKYNVGDKVSVWYVPANPANHAIGDKGYQSAHILFIFAAIVMLVISAAFWFEYLATRPRKRKYRWPDSQLGEQRLVGEQWGTLSKRRHPVAAREHASGITGGTQPSIRITQVIAAPRLCCI
jgi:Protein of unknown function (DUF3592)